MRLLIASNNPKKRRELERILDAILPGAAAAQRIGVVTPVDLGIALEPDESGSTFEENALLKARAFAGRTDLPVLADDSGLEVDALAGAPGVRSARFAGGRGGDAANRARLLAELAGVPAEARSARFVCCVALVRRGAREVQVLAQARGTCEGTILERERGAGGFGYDPLFLDGATQRSFAELSPEEKDRSSHRGQALRAIAPALVRLLAVPMTNSGPPGAGRSRD